MADLLRISRPWLLSPFQSRAPSIVFLNLYRGISTTSPRPYASKGTGRSKRTGVSQAKSSDLKKPRQSELVHMENNMTVLIPNTFVAPPFWRYPREPRKFAQMLWLHAKNRFQTLWSIIMMKVLSQPTILLSKPRFQFQRSAAIPTAKALHVQMSEAVAAGDKETLRMICTPELYQTLAATVDSRPKGMRAEWELVRYDQRWRYPRVADWRCGYQPLSDGNMKLVKQIVVSIASVQRITRYDDSRGGIKIAGSERARHITEHFVLQATMDKTTFESDPWKIWGTLSETTYEQYQADAENFQALMVDQAAGKT